MTNKKADKENAGARKAAMLLIMLGEQTSAEVLQTMEDEEIALLGREMARIESIEAAEADSVLTDFQQTYVARDYVVQGGVDYARRVLSTAFGATQGKKLLDQLTRMLTPESTHFEPLERADPAQLARFIHGEHPQTVALVLSHLNPSKAAELLASLPAEMRADVALRMASIDQTSPEVTAKVAAAIGAKLQTLGDVSRESFGGVRAVAEMFNRMESGASKVVLETIERENPALVENIRQLMFVFDDILMLGPADVRTIVTKVDKKLLATALKGTSEQMRAHLLSGMSQRSAEMVVEDMEALGPTKIKDVEAAQRQIVLLVRKLEEEGAISLKTTAEAYVV